MKEETETQREKKYVYGFKAYSETERPNQAEM